MNSLPIKIRARSKYSVEINLSLEAIDQLNIFGSFYCVLKGRFGK